MAGRPAAPPAPPPPKKLASPTATIPAAVSFDISRGKLGGAERIVVYGTGAIGKTTLCAYLPAPLFIDLEHGSRKLEVARTDAADWMTLRGILASIAEAPPEGVRSVVIDSASVAEKMATEHVIATRKTEKGRAVESIEGYGWGKGWQFVAEEFDGLLADLDRIVAHGLHVALIAHDVSSPVPNPGGEDFIRYEPHLYAGDKKGRGSIRERVKQWSDHLMFLGYDVYVEDGKGKGAGTRTIWTQELPTHVAGSRTKLFSVPFDISDPGAVWRELGIS